MTDRDRLIELISQIQYMGGLESRLAEHLLANGIIVPPCKVGDTVYTVGDIDGHQIKECKVRFFHFESAEGLDVDVYFDCDDNCDGCYFNAWRQSYCGEWDCENAYGQSCIPISDFGKTVFLTKEEAEKALKEREGK